MNMNKKGFMSFFFIIITILLLAGLMLVASYLVVDKIDNTNLFKDYDDAQEVVDNGKNALLSMDTMMIFILLGLSLFVIVSAAVAFNHPALLFISIFLLFIAITLSGIVSNTFAVFSDDIEISAVTAVYPKMTFLFNNLPVYILMMGVAVSIAMYVSWRQY